MSKERELLRRALDDWDAEDINTARTDEVMEEIRAHLAAEGDNTIEVPRDIYVHLKKGQVTPSDLVEAIKKAEKEVRND